VCWRREFSGLPVYVGVEEGSKRAAPMDKRQFRRYLETCRRLSFRFDGGQAAGGAEGCLGFFQRTSPVDGLSHVLGRSL
jgi:hypothetical protein